MGYLLDTSAAILLRDGDRSAHRKLEALEEAPALSVLTRVELEGGVYARPEFSAQRRAALDAILSELAVIDYDNEMAEAYGAIIARTGFARRKIIDRMIAATALVQGLALITTNPADFADVPGLVVIDWQTGP